MLEATRVFEVAIASHRAVVRLVGETAECTALVRSYTHREKVALIEIDFSAAPSGAAVVRFTADSFLLAIEMLGRAFPRLHQTHCRIAAQIGVEPHAALGLGVAHMLDALEFAAKETAVRPIIHFARADSLAGSGEYGFSIAWTLRNHAQHHVHCRYVFSGNRETYSVLDSGNEAPLLHLGTRIDLRTYEAA